MFQFSFDCFDDFRNRAAKETSIFLKAVKIVLNFGHRVHRILINFQLEKKKKKQIQYENTNANAFMKNEFRKPENEETKKYEFNRKKTLPGYKQYLTQGTKLKLLNVSKPERKYYLIQLNTK